MDYNYYVCDKTSPQNHIFDLTEIEFKELENLYQTFSKFSNIVDCYYNFIISAQDLIDLLDFISSPKCNKNKNDEVMKIYSHLKYRFVTNVMFGRLLYDNYQNFCKLLKKNQFNTIKEKYKTNESFMMMKLLRDYSAHYSLAISGLTRSISFTQKFDQLSIYVEKGDLEKNYGANRENDQFLKTIDKDKILLIDEFYKWRDAVDEFYNEVLESFVDTMTVIQKELFYSNFKYRNGLPNFVDPKLFIPDSIHMTLPQKNNPVELDGKKYIESKTIKFYSFNTPALEEVINVLKEKFKRVD
ncbi:hypothetical protein [Streptococcus uberis]|uniref:hypothetical protein n=1 Tax=Streptococcus uberis TaxID=1349 RepID=UPI0027DE6C51|nr:hypothetical protein [Streptococcus uberis]MCK1235415.1 hypothetical protein [Streptococcus uberis]